jgi:lipopolysaccharide/colanic/teichoic acid biosynthesis glycosyltransferase
MKRIFDGAGALFLLVILSPVLIMAGLAVRLFSGSPVFFKQVRTGRHGRPFTLYKFRTMVRGAEARLAEVRDLNEVRGPVFKIRRDPRATGVGLLLRLFSVDELPQLVNVLRGDMSLVGPRPPLPAEVVRYEAWQWRRLSVTPGMTCTWQASGRHAIPFSRWVEMDLAYIDTWSPTQDVLILLKTLPAVLFATGVR